MLPQIVVDLGLNHGGNAELAARLAHDAEEVGASAVKLQLYDADALCAARADTSNLDLLRKAQLSVDDLQMIRDRVRIPVFASVFNAELLDRYADAGFTRVKIAAHEAEHAWGLVQAIGAHTAFGRVDISVSPSLTANGGLLGRLALLCRPSRVVCALHCIPCYPVMQPQDWKLWQIRILRGVMREHEGTAGLSAHFSAAGHYLGTVTAAAIACGATTIEVHYSGFLFTDCPEGKWSLDRAGLQCLRRIVDDTAAVLSQN